MQNLMNYDRCGAVGKIGDLDKVAYMYILQLFYIPDFFTDKKL